MTAVSPRQLEQALRACARGIRHHEAGTSLLIGCGHWLHRDDFTSRFIEHSTSGGTPMAATDWEAAITALHPAGSRPAAGNGGCSSWPPASPAGPRSASATPWPASTAATPASSSAPSPTPPDFQIHIKKRTNRNETVSSEKQECSWMQLVA